MVLPTLGPYTCSWAGCVVRAIFLDACISKRCLLGPGIDGACWWKICLSKVRERIYNCKLSKLTTLKGSSGAYLPITRFWLEQTLTFPGSTELSLAGILEGGWGHPRDTDIKLLEYMLELRLDWAGIWMKSLCAKWTFVFFHTKL